MLRTVIARRSPKPLALLLAVALALFWVVSMQSSAGAAEAEVRICHAKGSWTKGWNHNPPAGPSKILSGHAAHSDDIIPELPPELPKGLNLDRKFNGVEGRAILAAGCVLTPPPAEDPPAEDPPAEDPPAEDPPAEDPPAEDPPAEDPPAEDPPAEDPPAEDPPAEDPPAEDPPAEDPPAEDPPAEDPPAEDPPAEDPPAEDPPAEDPPADDPPAEDPPADDPRAEDPPADDPPAEEPPAEEPGDGEQPEPEGELLIRQSANPASGTHLMVGDEITYTITVTAKGEADQEDVVVWDVVPGFDSDLPDSLSTTYVAESADCDVECWITEVDEGLLIWELGDLAAGESASVWFTVEIDKVNMPGMGTVRVGNVSNVAWAESVTDGPVLSNTVNHPVSAVLSGKITNPPAKPTKPVLGAPVRPVEHVKEVGTKVVSAKVLAKALPRTGVDVGLPLGLGGVLLLLGGAMVAGTRQRKQPAHRK